MPAATRVRFFNTKPVDQVKYVTIEIYHSELGLLRYVTGQQIDKTFRLETDAPRNPDEDVVFNPFFFDSPEPEQGGDSDGATVINLGAVGVQFKEKTKLITDAGWREPFQLIRREHFSDITYPTLVLNYEIADFNLTDLQVSLSCRQINRSSEDISELQTVDRFEGLGELY